MPLSGNIGHDLYNGWLDHFGQQEAARDEGRANYYDAIVWCLVWFRGPQDFEAAQGSTAAEKHWSLVLADILFNRSTTRPIPTFTMPCGGRQPSWAPNNQDGAHSRKWRQATLPAGLLCANELHVKTPITSASGLQWGALRWAARVRAYAFKRLNIPREPGAAIQLSTRVFYTRGDASRRQLIVRTAYREAIQSYLGVTLWLDRMPTPVKDQLQIFAKADIFITGVGSNTANAIFMRPHSTFIELSTFCASTCLEGCHPHSLTGPAARPGQSSIMAQFISLESSNACLMLLSEHAFA